MLHISGCSTWRPAALVGALALPAALLVAAPAGAVVPTTCNGLAVTVTGSDSGEQVSDPDPATAQVVHLGGGNDVWIGGGGDDVVCGGDGDDTITGGTGNDTLLGEAGNDRLIGAAGNDTVDGGDGADHLEAGDAGDDTLRGGVGGDDRISYQAATAGVTVDVVAGTLVGTGTGTDTVSGVEEFALTSFADTFTGGPGPDVVDGLGGADVLTGAGGADNLIGAQVIGGDGDDRLDATDTADGGAGNDRIKNRGDGVTNGGDGDDRITAKGRTAVSGGPGADVLRVRGGVAPVSLAGGSGRDRLSLWANKPVKLDLRRNFLRTPGLPEVTVKSIAEAKGSSADDTLRGSNGSNLLLGAGGADKLRGRSGQDRLVGGRGLDSAKGGKGSDRCFAERTSSC